MSISRLSLLAAALLAAGSAAAQAADGAYPAKAATCISCHSADGNPLVAGVPILAGQRADYLVSALKAYAAGRRSGGGATVMAGFAAKLSDQDMKELAAWFSSQ